MLMLDGEGESRPSLVSTTPGIKADGVKDIAAAKGYLVQLLAAQRAGSFAVGCIHGHSVGCDCYRFVYLADLQLDVIEHALLGGIDDDSRFLIDFEAG